MTNTVSVKEKYSLEGQHIDPLVGGAIKSDGTFTFIHNPNLTEEALKQIYDSLYDYQVSEEAMAALGPAAAPVINISNFYGWIYSSDATDSALKEKFIKVLQALITPGSWKLPSTDSNLPFENHSYPAKGDGTDGFDSLEGYLGLERPDDGLGLIAIFFNNYKESFNALKTYLEGKATWTDLTELKRIVGELVSDTFILGEHLGDPKYGSFYPKQAKELESFYKSLDVLSDIIYFWAKNGGATLATTKQFFASDIYQEYTNNYLFAAADARQKVVMIGGEEQLTAALLQDLIVKRGKMLEEYTLGLNIVQIYLDYNGATDLMKAAHDKFSEIRKLCISIYNNAISSSHDVQASHAIREGGKDSELFAYIHAFSGKAILNLFSGNSISKENTFQLREDLLHLNHTYEWWDKTGEGKVNVHAVNSFVSVLCEAYEHINSALRYAIDEVVQEDWNILLNPLKLLEKQLDLIISYYDAKEVVDALVKKYKVASINGLEVFLTTLIEAAQGDYDKALSAYERLTAPVEYDRLLSLVLMYDPFDGTGQRITALTKNANGTYTAALAEEYTSEISLKSCEERMNLPYFALAMCYEKTVILGTVIVAHVKEIEDLNAEITKNNKWLRYANEAYQNYYSWAIYSNNIYAYSSSRLWRVISTKAGNTPSDANVAMEGAKNFLNYLREECGIRGIDVDAEKIVHWGDYNAKGEFQKGGDTFNIDVEEQGFLTLISNWQEAIRQRGDWLSTESQKKTLELTQDFQTYNSACGINSQICKVAGGTYDAVASNIR